MTNSATAMLDRAINRNAERQRSKSNGAPISPQFNAAVMTIANRLNPGGWDIGTDAPNTLEELQAYIKDHNRMKVYSGSSEKTIFGCAEHNWAFRAWHDWHHWKWAIPFTAVGEHTVCNHQIMDLKTVYGSSDMTEYWCRLLRAEVDGQGRYFEAHGEFPVDQKAFVLAYLDNPDQALRNIF